MTMFSYYFNGKVYLIQSIYSFFSYFVLFRYCNSKCYYSYFRHTMFQHQSHHQYQFHFFIFIRSPHSQPILKSLCCLFDKHILSLLLLFGLLLLFLLTLIWIIALPHYFRTLMLAKALTPFLHYFLYDFSFLLNFFSVLCPAWLP